MVRGSLVRRLLLVGLLVLCLPLAAAAQSTGRITGTVADATGAVLPGATVTARMGATTRTTISDASGRYTIESLPPGVWEVSFELSGFAGKTSQVTVAAGQPATLEARLEIGARSEAVQVTGTLIPRPNMDAMSPVTTLEVEELTYRGMTRIEDLLTTLPQVFVAQNSTIANGASGTATVDLRGLGSQRTLVLLDGRRMPAGDAFDTAPDLNFIPSALVKRVDVLTGGASSVYGADAVSGVVNFVLDKDFEGVRGGVQISSYQHNNNNDAGAADQRGQGLHCPEREHVEQRAAGLQRRARRQVRRRRQGPRDALPRLPRDRRDHEGRARLHQLLGPAAWAPTARRAAVRAPGRTGASWSTTPTADRKGTTSST